MTDKPEPPRVPTQTLDAMQRFSDDMDELHLLQGLCVAGMSALRAMPGVVRIHLTSPSDDPAVSDKLVAAAKKTADLATQEFEKDFPLLRALGTVAVWSHLEGHFKTLLAHCVHHELPKNHKKKNGASHQI